jgi:chloramphenicol-sensitive protein RarD
MNLTSAHLAAVSAFSLWGLFPLYWKIFPEVGAWDLFGHRLIWSFITVMLILIFQKKLKNLKSIWHQKKVRYMLMLSALFISSNWLIYIYAISVGKVLEASMGYFLNPLINVLFGWFILKENLRFTQWPAIFLALFSIVLMGIQTELSHFPWMAIVLSLTFALYGIIRKTTHVGALEGLAFETCFIVGPVLIYWLFQKSTPVTIYSELPLWKLGFLSLSGLITCTPLILFAFSARRLKLQTIGFIQYLSPSLKFLCGLFVLNESLTFEKLQAFVLIWIALGWYTIESFLFLKKQKKAIPISE